LPDNLFKSFAFNPALTAFGFANATLFALAAVDHLLYICFALVAPLTA
jgi:hypothetical protein